MAYVTPYGEGTVIPDVTPDELYEIIDRFRIGYRQRKADRELRRREAEELRLKALADRDGGQDESPFFWVIAICDGDGCFEWVVAEQKGS